MKDKNPRVFPFFTGFHKTLLLTACVCYAQITAVTGIQNELLLPPPLNISKTTEIEQAVAIPPSTTAYLLR